ncbi:DNA-binding transcriptional regulator, LysR family [Marinomonas polaris DSM 16579]|uniref:DNA-binding transcriptional regulator, LysR family n=1 Tax=Marinomonas polaris DSM 16579 TaxID=1122206 RepID=A0A1M4XF78_9GAMM|nr:LysR family transcriptional regulator [Marinomonas polaris]SHE91993.1 DNA-binding transcriptional regulator, LysR family [Marinomonas polaris DSM 16579]
MLTLDVDSVRAFVAIADLKSFTQAANLLGTTQAALSLRLKRLEERVKRRLIERTPRQVRLSSYGELFIASARDFLEAHERAVESLLLAKKRLKLGIGCHLIGSELQTMLAKVNELDPDLVLEISTDTSTKVKEEYLNGELDAVILRSEEERKEGLILCIEHYSWYASPNFQYSPNEPLRLAILDEKCGVRDQAPLILKKAGLRSNNVLIAGSTEVVNAAISAGMAVGIYSQRMAPEDSIDVRELFNLPSLPTSSIELHTHLTDQKTRKILKVISSVFNEYTADEDLALY